MNILQHDSLEFQFTILWFGEQDTLSDEEYISPQEVPELTSITASQVTFQRLPQYQKMLESSKFKTCTLFVPASGNRF